MMLAGLPLAAQAALDCPQAALVTVTGQGEGLVEGMGETGLCLVRLAGGRLIEVPAADLQHAQAGDTPPPAPLPKGLLSCGEGQARFGIALAPGLYIDDSGMAGRFGQSGGDLGFETGPLAGAAGRIEGDRVVLSLPRRAEAVCTHWQAG